MKGYTPETAKQHDANRRELLKRTASFIAGAGVVELLRLLLSKESND